mgnify:CR=1 FL=1
MSKVLFCEGGYDRQVLEKVVDGLDWTIESVGGVRGMRSFMKGYAQANKLLKGRKMGFRDRDFDFPVDEYEQLYLDKRNIAVAARICIENYLISPPVIQKYLEKQKVETALPDIEERFFEAYEKLKYYQTVRHALGKTRNPVNLATRWTAASGKLPDELSETYCLRAGKQLIETYIKENKSITVAAFDENYADFLQKFDNAFLQSHKPLIWFHGKDLMTQLIPKIQEYYAKFGRNNYYDFALKVFDYTQFPDLIQLREHLKTI